MAKITEGYMPFHGYQTYYRIVGEQKDNGKAPVDLLTRWTWIFTQLL